MDVGGCPNHHEITMLAICSSLDFNFLLLHHLIRITTVFVKVQLWSQAM